MTHSVSSILQAALSAARLTQEETYTVRSSLTPAQIGAVFKARELGTVVTEGEADVLLERFPSYLSSAISDSGFVESLRTLKDSAFLEHAVGALFDNPTDENVSVLGYWVATNFVRGVRERDIEALTSFLSGGRRSHEAADSVLSVRRYPSGGISEKQALILPVLIKHFAERGRWRSDFLIAGLLSFTGGTRAKLSVIPGFHTFPPVSSLDMGGRPRVAYISAGKNLCPRDALLYRIRSETGTVVDLGLMASSIMSKQIAAPADVIVLDVLYGDGAFLKTLEEAIEFGSICAGLGAANGLNVIFVPRPSQGSLGSCIGASTEIWEAAATLSSAALDPLQQKEFDQARDFLAIFARNCGLDASGLAEEAESERLNGRLFATMLDLWREHGADSAWINSFAHEPYASLTKGLKRYDVVAEEMGELYYSAAMLADFVNTEINLVSSDYGEEPSVRKGGIVLRASQGSKCKKNTVIMNLFCESEIVFDFMKLRAVFPFKVGLVDR